MLRPARTLRSRPAPAGRPAGPRGPGRIAAAVRARLRRGGRERGANPVELAVMMPVILVLLFGSIQVAVWFVARSTALNAAQTGVNAQRTFDASPTAGRDRATSFLRRSGDWLIGWDRTGPTCVETATDVTCTVRGRSLSVIPGVDFEVVQTAHGPAERWTAG
ncbi:TadE family protein [Micromonospora sp. WMMD980]|uniref:TadE family protein n=1 Tax=Micromonospora sp. WMMD980 TaxID=3016088 RepID=UPI0024171BB5|nr:TadE family protein [Micromonospora sp. WMMD980]MDG4803785.1 pilus assembly protein [Micromonospora sp. WMMD980]